jgi:hypothetical protein
MGGKDTHDKSTVEFIMWTLTLGPVSFLASCCYSTLGPISHVFHSYLSLRKEKAQFDDSRWLSCITLHCTTLHFKGVIYRHPTLIKRRPICPGNPLQLFSRGDACVSSDQQQWETFNQSRTASYPRRSTYKYAHLSRSEHPDSGGSTCTFGSRQWSPYVS